MNECLKCSSAPPSSSHIIFGHQLKALQFKSVLNSRPETASNPTGLRARSHRAAPPQMPIPSLGCHLCLWLRIVNPRFSGPCLKFDHLLEQLTKLRERTLVRRAESRSAPSAGLLSLETWGHRPLVWMVLARLCLFLNHHQKEKSFSLNNSI